MECCINEHESHIQIIRNKMEKSLLHQLWNHKLCFITTSLLHDIQQIFTTITMFCSLCVLLTFTPGRSVHFSVNIRTIRECYSVFLPRALTGVTNCSYQALQLSLRVCIQVTKYGIPCNFVSDWGIPMLCVGVTINLKQRTSTIVGSDLEV